MEEYHIKSSCPKCDFKFKSELSHCDEVFNNRFSMTFHTQAYVILANDTPDVYMDYIVFVCNRCGYSWETHTADYKPEDE